MATVGSYVLSINERSGSGSVDIKTACAHVLKLLGGQQGMSFAALLSATGFPEELLREAVRQLQQEELVTGSDERWILTELGYQAHFIVAT